MYAQVFFLENSSALIQDKHRPLGLMSCLGVSFNFTCTVVSVFSIFMLIVWFIYITVLTNNPKQQMYWQKTPNIKVLWVAF